MGPTIVMVKSAPLLRYTQEILRKLGNSIEIRKERLLSNEKAKEDKFRSRPSNTHRYDVFLDEIKIGVAKGGYLYVLDKQIIALAEKALK